MPTTMSHCESGLAAYEMTCVPARFGARSNTLTGAESPSAAQWNAELTVTIAIVFEEIHVQYCTASVSGSLKLLIFF